MSVTYVKPWPHGTVTVTVAREDGLVREDWRFSGRPYPAMAFRARFPRLLALKIGFGLRRGGFSRVRTRS